MAAIYQIRINEANEGKAELMRNASSVKLRRGCCRARASN
jgi:hypothetical protein